MQHLEVEVWLNFFRKEKRKLILFPFCGMVNLGLLAPRTKIAFIN
jgi:putative methionine-R-sulfoxide reductase with GAF domain